MTFSHKLMADIRDRFAHVDHCPFEGERVFFENAGGALTLNSVVATSAKFAAIPDNQGRDNAASHALVDIIAKARADMALLLNAPGGQVVIGESGTEMLFRMIRTACMAAGSGVVLGSTLEHPASRSAAAHWAARAGQEHRLISHDDGTGSVSALAYADAVTPDTVVATIVHTSPVTGMGVDLVGISRAIRSVAPDCLIIVDGIQHAAHGAMDLAKANIDGYAISPYKMFSRHGYGVGWISDKLAGLPHECLDGGPPLNWEFGTRDTGAYATLSDVVDYLDWLGGQVSETTDPRARLEAAARAIHDHEAALTHAMIHGHGNLKGLAAMDHVTLIGGADNPLREGLVSLWVDGLASGDLVTALRDRGIRVHIRKADHYSGNILDPLGRADCVRVSMCHYNSLDEVSRFLSAMREIVDEVPRET